MKKGSYHSKESIEKMSNAHKGKILSEKAKKKISDSNKETILNKGENNPMFGKRHSKKSIEKMSKAKQGKKGYWYGKHRTKDDIEKISISNKGENHWNYGKHPSEETKERMSIAKRGEKSYNRKGGISFEPYYQKFNEEIRDKFRIQCFICSGSEELNGRKLSVYHINYNKDCLCNDSKCYLVPLCNSCHSKTNFNREFWEKLLTDCYEYPEIMKYLDNSNINIFEIKKTEN